MPGMVPKGELSYITIFRGQYNSLTLVKGAYLLPLLSARRVFKKIARMHHRYQAVFMVFGYGIGRSHRAIFLPWEASGSPTTYLRMVFAGSDEITPPGG